MVFPPFPFSFRKAMKKSAEELTTFLLSARQPACESPHPLAAYSIGQSSAIRASALGLALPHPIAFFGAPTLCSCTASPSTLP